MRPRRPSESLGRRKARGTRKQSAASKGAYFEYGTELASVADKVSKMGHFAAARFTGRLIPRGGGCARSSRRHSAAVFQSGERRRNAPPESAGSARGPRRRPPAVGGRRAARSARGIRAASRRGTAHAREHPEAQKAQIAALHRFDRRFGRQQRRGELPGAPGEPAGCARRRARSRRCGAAKAQQQPPQRQEGGAQPRQKRRLGPKYTGAVGLRRILSSSISCRISSTTKVATNPPPNSSTTQRPGGCRWTAS